MEKKYIYKKRSLCVQKEIIVLKLLLLLLLLTLPCRVELKNKKYMVQNADPPAGARTLSLQSLHGVDWRTVAQPRSLSPEDGDVKLERRGSGLDWLANTKMLGVCVCVVLSPQHSQFS